MQNDESLPTSNVNLEENISSEAAAADSLIGKEKEKEEAIDSSSAASVPETSPLTSSDLLTPQHGTSSSIPIIGIDFGSSSSVVASSVVGSSKLPGLVQNRISSVGTPSEVGFRENQRLFGEDCYTNDPENTASDFKRLLGKKFSEIGQEASHYLTPLSEDENGGINFSVDYCGSSQKFNVERLAAMIFHQLVSYTGNANAPTVFSIPRVFSDSHLQAFRHAAKIAGVNLAGFIHDLSAAALVYAHTRVQHGSQREVVLFADMGQAFFQLQLVEFSENHFRVLSHHAETLGGRDFTDRLQKYLSEEIAAKYKVDVTKKPRNVWQMKKESLRLKKVLSTVPLVKFEYFIMDTDVSVQCTRAKFDDVCADLLDRIHPAVQKVLSEGSEVLKASGSDLSGGISLEIIGGGLIVPAILNRLKSSCGVADARRSLDSQSCRAIGAGLFGALFYQEGAGIQVTRKEGETGYSIDDPTLVTINTLPVGEDVSVEKEHEEELVMCKRDADVAALATKRNQMEERIFFLRDKIRESPEAVGLQSDVAMREKLYEALKEVEDWLLYSDEGSNASISQIDEKLAELDGKVKEIAPKFHQHLEDMEMERRKLEEKARQDEAEMHNLRSRDKTERPLKKGEFIAAAEKRKQQGNQAIKEDDYDGASVRYKQALSNFPLIREELTPEEEAEVKQIKLACYLNLALCHLKKPGREDKVIHNCDDALAIDPNNVKALFRRGSAYLNKKEYENARKDFKTALQHDASNKATQKQLALVEKRIQEQVQKEKKMYGKMFG